MPAAGWSLAPVGPLGTKKVVYELSASSRLQPVPLKPAAYELFRCNAPIESWLLSLEQGFRGGLEAARKGSGSNSGRMSDRQ